LWGFEKLGKVSSKRIRSLLGENHLPDVLEVLLHALFEVLLRVTDVSHTCG
jgi:hypothetical protein